MKFSLSIDALSKENKFLKLVTKLLFANVFILIIQITYLFNRDPILIQSSTRGLELVQAMPFEKSELEIKSAATLMLKARFNTQTVSANLFLSDKQKKLRESEQKELKNRNMQQDIVIRNIEITKDNALVDLDRVIAVGEIRTAIRTKLKIAFEDTEPNELNPYGLVLALTEVLQPEVKK